MKYAISCGPAVLMCIAWVFVLAPSGRRHLTVLGSIALAVATLNAVLAAATVLYYEARPLVNLPPWKDPEILNLGLLSMTAPIAVALAYWAGLRGTPKWIVWIVCLASVPLFAIGCLAVAAY